MLKYKVTLIVEANEEIDIDEFKGCLMDNLIEGETLTDFKIETLESVVSPIETLSPATPAESLEDSK